jgi:hypothetical protein
LADFGSLFSGQFGSKMAIVMLYDKLAKKYFQLLISIKEASYQLFWGDKKSKCHRI